MLTITMQPPTGHDPQNLSNDRVVLGRFGVMLLWFGCRLSLSPVGVWSLAIRLLFAGAVLCCTALAAWTADRPNIIFIMADDLGYGDLGCYGQKVIQTPNIDQLAAQGMRFTDHYAGHTVCRPSRLVLWTGQHVGHTKLIGNASRNLTGSEATVAKLLQQDGYATGGVGKWALGHVEQPSQIDNLGHPNNNGFDYWFGYMNQSHAHNYFPTVLWENKTQVVLPGNVIADDPQGRGLVSSKRVTYAHDVITARALKFIADHQNVPFLLHIHWTIPHANNEGGRVWGDGMEIPEYGIYAHKDWPSTEKGFAAMISRMDADVGRLMRLLRQLDIEQETIVLFSSDNGPHNEGGHDHNFFDSNGPLKGFKRSLHDGGIRVPLIARWQGHIKAGTTTRHPSAFWDFLPTACELAGTSIPSHWKTDGISYLPTLLGRNSEQRQHPYLYWASSEGETSVGVRRGDWKLVQYRKTDTQSKEAPDWRLYDLKTDVGEQHDVAAQNPNIVKQILDLLRRDKLYQN